MPCVVARRRCAGGWALWEGEECGWEERGCGKRLEGVAARAKVGGVARREDTWGQKPVVARCCARAVRTRRGPALLEVLAELQGTGEPTACNAADPRPGQQREQR